MAVSGVDDPLLDLGEHVVFVVNFSPDLSAPLNLSYLVAIGVPASTVPGECTVANAFAAPILSFPPRNVTQWGPAITSASVLVFDADGEAILLGFRLW